MISRKGIRRQLKWKESKGGTPKLNSWGVFFWLEREVWNLKTIYLLVNLQKNTGWFSSYLLADLKLRKISLNNYLNYLKEEAFFSLIACERSLCRRPSNILSCMREFPYAIRKRNDALSSFSSSAHWNRFAFVSFDVMAVDSGWSCCRVYFATS